MGRMWRWETSCTKPPTADHILNEAFKWSNHNHHAGKGTPFCSVVEQDSFRELVLLLLLHCGKSHKWCWKQLSPSFGVLHAALEFYFARMHYCTRCAICTAAMHLLLTAGLDAMSHAGVILSSPPVAYRLTAGLFQRRCFMLTDSYITCDIMVVFCCLVASFLWFGWMSPLSVWVTSHQIVKDVFSSSIFQLSLRRKLYFYRALLCHAWASEWFEGIIKNNTFPCRFRLLFVESIEHTYHL